MRHALHAAVLMVLFGATRAPAGTITFETTPSGGTPVDDALLTDPYTYSGGSVRFFFDANANNRYDAGVDVFPNFEHIGDDGTNGFDSNTVGVPDTARSGYAAQLGAWFVRPPATGLPGPFIAAYSSATPIRSLSGEIWDIDARNGGNTEQWRVDVLSGTGTELASTLSPLGDDNGPSSLDSLPWTFAFTGLPDGVADVRLTFVGSKPGAVGLAFNNFSPDVALPEPSSLGLLATLTTALGLRRRRTACA
jgi:hypothetical protein